MKKFNLQKPAFVGRRNFKYGSVATAITFGFIAVVIVINIIATVLLQKFPLSIDLTSTGKFEISQQTVDYVKAVDTDINIYVCAAESYFTDPSQTQYYQADQMIKKYAQYNDKIKVSYINLESNPGFAANYKDLTISTGDIVVQSSLRYQKFSYSDMFSYTYDSTGSTVTSMTSKAEQKITSSILYVTDANPMTVEFVTNHDEAAMASLKSLFTNNGYTTKDVDLLTGEIDANAALVVIAAPTRDFTAPEITKLDNFLTNGGAYGKQVYYYASPNQPVMSTIENYLGEWGIGFQTGAIYETSTDLTYGSPFITLMDNASIDLTSIGRTEAISAPVTMQAVRPVTQLFEARNLRKTSVLMKTHESSVLYPPDATASWSPADQTKQTFNTIVMGQKSTDTTDASKIKYSTIVAFGSPDTSFSLTGVSGDALDSASFGDSQLMASLTNKLTGKGDSGITVVAKDLTAAALEINGTTAIILGLIFVVALPLAILIWGIVVFMRRRNL